MIALVPAYYELRKLEGAQVEAEGLGKDGMEGVLWFPQKSKRNIVSERDAAARLPG